MIKQDQKGYVLTSEEQIKGLENLISHLETKTGNTLPNTHPYKMKLKELSGLSHYK
jgi:galactose-1-phosphate uridylyltransferase|tara:strand:+ start:75 stop:242 length:168 start_codon:yes stop_codon:yes gene_type:complete